MKYFLAFIASHLMIILQVDSGLFASELDFSGAGYEQRQSRWLADINSSISQLEGLTSVPSVVNTLKPYDRILIELGAAFAESSVFSNMHPDERVRKLAMQARSDLSELATSRLSLNVKLFERLKRVDVSEVDASTKRMYELTMQDFRRSGVSKSPEVRKKIAILQKKLTQVGQDFSSTIRDDVRSLKFTRQELEGLPEDYFASRPVGKDGMIEVSTRYPDYFPVLKYADNENVRKKMYLLNNQRGYPENQKNLRFMIEGRYQMARLLGYPSWAAYNTETKMVETPLKARAFLLQMHKAASDRSRRDYQRLLQEKRKIDPKAQDVNAWEGGWLGQKVRKADIDFDAREIRPWFPYNQVKRGIMETVSGLFDVNFKKVSDAKVWHKDVETWDVYENEKKIGRIFLDMFPRKGKFGHAAQFSLRQGIKGQTLPHGVLVCNFPQPTSDDPALMEHSQVETFLHEFGHLMQYVFSGRHKWSKLGGRHKEWDFVEVPSMLLEEWVWDEKGLGLIAKHHQKGTALPPTLIAKMRKAKDFGVGVRASQQIYYSMISLSLYDTAPTFIDFSRFEKELQTRFSPFPYIPESKKLYSFGHLNGYSASYYTYIWSEVIAKDLFSVFKKKGLFDRVTAERYKRLILTPAARKPAKEQIRDFLGRDYSFDSYIKWLRSA